MRILCLIPALCALAVRLVGQQPPGPNPSTRTAEIEQAREKKEAALRPDEVSRAERFLRDLKDKKYLERFTSGYNGFNVKLGNMVTGGGFAIGPEYSREDLMLEILPSQHRRNGPLELIRNMRSRRRCRGS